MRDTFLPAIENDLLAELRPRAESVLSELGHGTERAVWARRVPNAVEPPTPYVILDVEQDEAPQYETLDKFGIGADVEARCVARAQQVAESVRDALQEDLSDLDGPPVPDGLSHVYTQDLPNLPASAIAAEAPELFEPTVRLRMIFRTE